MERGTTYTVRGLGQSQARRAVIPRDARHIVGARVNKARAFPRSAIRLPESGRLQSWGTRTKSSAIEARVVDVGRRPRQSTTVQGLTEYGRSDDRNVRGILAV